jgi:hypothetical protein
VIKQRMWSGRLNKARRGELAFALPSGYVRGRSGEVALDPDEQVQTVIHLFFAQFERLGTLHGVLRYLVDHDIQLGIRLREGPDRATLEWRRPKPDDAADPAAQSGLFRHLRSIPGTDGM